MKAVLVFLLFTAALGDARAFEPKSLPECRLAFLLGMSTGSRGTAWEVFWGGAREDECRALFERLGRAYAGDLGASPEELRTEQWRARVMAALRAQRDPAKPLGGLAAGWLGEGLGQPGPRRVDLLSAFAAGAYARHAAPGGFKLGDSPKGMELVLVIRALSALAIDFSIRPGLPGNMTITLSGGGDRELEDFFAELKIVRDVLAARP